MLKQALHLVILAIFRQWLTFRADVVYYNCNMVLIGVSGISHALTSPHSRGRAGKGPVMPLFPLNVILNVIVHSLHG